MTSQKLVTLCIKYSREPELIKEEEQIIKVEIN